MYAGVALTQLDDVTVVGLAAPALTPAALASWATLTLDDGERLIDIGRSMQAVEGALPDESPVA